MKKNEENKTTNESTWNIFVARFSFGMFASVIYVINCNIVVHEYKQLVETFRGYPQFYTLSPLPKRHSEKSCSQKGVF